MRALLLTVGAAPRVQELSGGRSQIDWFIGSPVDAVDLASDVVMFTCAHPNRSFNPTASKVACLLRLQDQASVHGHVMVLGLTRDHELTHCPQRVLSMVGLTDERDPNRLARALADALDERDTARAELAEAQQARGAAEAERDSAHTWLALIAKSDCVRLRHPKGACIGTERYASSRYAFNQWCDPCRAWAALHDVPMSTEPEPKREGTR